MDEKVTYVYHGSTHKGLTKIKKIKVPMVNYGYMELYLKLFLSFLSAIRVVIYIII